MGLFQFRPSREAAEAKQRELERSPLLADLDKLVSDPQVFRWDGRRHEIKPITVENFTKITAALSRIQNLTTEQSDNGDEIFDAYVALFSLVCDSIGREEVKRMEIPQRGALLQLILDCIRGRAQADNQGTEKKKTQVT